MWQTRVNQAGSPNRQTNTNARAGNPVSKRSGRHRAQGTGHRAQGIGCRALQGRVYRVQGIGPGLKAKDFDDLAEDLRGPTQLRIQRTGWTDMAPVFVWDWTETTSSQGSWCGCFDLHQSTITVFTPAKQILPSREMNQSLT